MRIYNFTVETPRKPRNLTLCFAGGVPMRIMLSLGEFRSRGGDVTEGSPGKEVGGGIELAIEAGATEGDDLEGPELIKGSNLT